MKAGVILIFVIALFSFNSKLIAGGKKLKVRDNIKNNEILIKRDALSQWCNETLDIGEIAFESMVIVKVNKEHYYLIAPEFRSNRVFAFELEKKKKQLWLSPDKKMHICTSGNGVNSFRVVGDEIMGCES